MKRITISLLSVVALTLAAPTQENNSFKGSWEVDGEGIILNFTSDSTVEISSEDDETVGGKGTYHVEDNKLKATVDNDGSTMNIVYEYNTISNDTVKVVTKSMVVDGDSMEVSTDTLTMIKNNSSSKNK